MIKLTKLLSEIIQESYKEQTGNNLSDEMVILYEDMRLFQEFADPNFVYPYKETEPNVWEFKDKYGNELGVQFNPSLKYIDSFFIAKKLNGEKVQIFDYETNQAGLDPLSKQGGSDTHRSDTICKIIRDEIIPKYLLQKKPSIIKIHPLNNYRHEIFWKCAEICKEKYPQIVIKQMGKEINLINM